MNLKFDLFIFFKLSVWQTQTISGGMAGSTRLVTVPGVRPTASSLVSANSGIRIARRPIPSGTTTTVFMPMARTQQLQQQGIQNPSPINVSNNNTNTISTVVSQQQQQQHIVVTTLESLAPGSDSNNATQASSNSESQI